MSNIFNINAHNDKPSAEFKADLLSKLKALFQEWSKNPPEHVTAVLESRDGLSKIIQVPYPIPREWYMLLESTPLSRAVLIDSNKRLYLLHGWKNGTNNGVVAIYREAPGNGT